MPRMLFGELQNPFACSLSLINHFFRMFLKIALSRGFSGALMTWVGCFSTPLCGREFVLHYWQVQQSWGKKMDVWALETQSVPFQGSSGTVKLSYICRAMHMRSLPCSFPVMVVLCSAGLCDWWISVRFLRWIWGLCATPLKWLSYNVMCSASKPWQLSWVTQPLLTHGPLVR